MVMALGRRSAQQATLDAVQTALDAGLDVAGKPLAALRTGPALPGAD